MKFKIAFNVLLLSLLAGAQARAEELQDYHAQARLTCNAAQFDPSGDVEVGSGSYTHRATALKAPLTVKSMLLDKCVANDQSAQLFYRVYPLLPTSSVCRFNIKLGIVKGMAAAAPRSVDDTLASLKAAAQTAGDVVLRDVVLKARNGRSIAMREAELTQVYPDQSRVHWYYFAYASGEDMVFGLWSDTAGALCTDSSEKTEFMAQFPWP